MIEKNYSCTYRLNILKLTTGLFLECLVKNIFKNYPDIEFEDLIGLDNRLCKWIMRPTNDWM